MKRTELFTVPVVIEGRTLTVTYRISIAADQRSESVPVARSRVDAVWGYAEAVPIRVSDGRQFDFILDPGGAGVTS